MINYLHLRSFHSTFSNCFLKANILGDKMMLFVSLVVVEVGFAFGICILEVLQL